MLMGWVTRQCKQWEQTRIIAYNILAVNRNPKKNFPTITEYMPLPTDPKVDMESEAARMQEVMDKYKEQLKNSGL